MGTGSFQSLPLVFSGAERSEGLRLTQVPVSACPDAQGVTAKNMQGAVGSVRTVLVLCVQTCACKSNEIYGQHHHCCAASGAVHEGSMSISPTAPPGPPDGSDSADSCWTTDEGVAGMGSPQTLGTE